MPPAPRKNKKRASKKKPKHPHSHAREVALQALYQITVADLPVQEVLRFGWLNRPMADDARSHAEHLVRRADERRAELDRRIGTLSHKDLSQISSIIRSILRMGIAELQEGRSAPAVLIDDYLNLTRVYDGDESVPFVNGILDAHVHDRISPHSPPAAAGPVRFEDLFASGEIESEEREA